MDSLKSLMDKKQYDLVIKLTENSNDSVALFYRLSALVAVGQSEEALKLIKSKRLILQNRLDILIKVHLEILCLLGRFDEAYDELKYYQELPYESQVVEEILKAMPDYIRKEEKNSYARREKSEEQIISLLMSNNDEEVLAALDAIKNQSLNNYLLPILKILRSHPRQVIRSFALLLLVNNKYDKEVDFLDGEKLIKVTPSSLDEPFKIKGCKDLEEFSLFLTNTYHDPSVVNNAINIVSSYLIYIYPHQLELSKEESLLVFGYLAKRLLRIDESDLPLMCTKYQLDYQKVLSEINKIDEVLKNF